MTLAQNDELITFDQIANVLVSEEVFVVSPAELHGLLAGQLASGARLMPDMWLKTVCELLELASLTQETSKIGLVGLYQQTLGQLESFDMGLSMLMPDDEAPLHQRIEALGQWSQGFMTGFGYQGKQTDQSLSDEAKESLNDLAQIGQVSSEDIEETEEAESDLMQLEEYVRMAALMLFAECNKSDETAEPAPQAMH
jgi:uncharacterized protein YgfB (UPF0149 family)